MLSGEKMRITNSGSRTRPGRVQDVVFELSAGKFVFGQRCDSG